MHTFWALLIVPALLLPVWAVRHLRMQLIWGICLSAVVFAVGWLSAGDLAGLMAGEFGFGELSKRLAYRLIAATDLPVTQTGIGCLLNLLMCRFVWKAP